MTTSANKLPTIKPDDLVRTPSGRTAICIGITADGRREVQDVLTGECFILKPELLYLVRAAPPKRWTELAPDPVKLVRRR